MLENRFIHHYCTFSSNQAIFV
uniref:Uncharacterized protein n=1 Tax=Anguilla anguilla TaxID=7936 RepID=A0A0E9VFT2_ANGAN